MDDIEIRIHEEINDYREKFRGFTLRQWLCGILAIAISVPLYLFTTPYIGDDLAGWLIILTASPFMIIGFIPIQQMDAEKIIPYLYRYYTMFAKPLPYKTEEAILAEKTAAKLAKHQRLEKHMYYQVYLKIKAGKERFAHGKKKQ